MLGDFLRLIELALALPAVPCPLPSDTPQVGTQESTLSRFASVLSALDQAFGPTGYRYVRTRLAALVVEGCRGVDIVLGQRLPSPDEWWIGLIDDSGHRVVVTTFPVSTDSIPIEVAQLAERIRRIDQGRRLARLAAGKLDNYWKSRLIRTLRRIGVPAAGRESFFLKGEVEVQTEAYLWQAATDRTSTVRSVLERMTDPTAMFLPRLLTLLTNQGDEQVQVTDRARREIPDTSIRAAIITLFGTTEEVTQLLLSADPKTRAAAVDHLAYRDDVAAVMALVATRLPLPTSFAQSLPSMIDFRDRVREQIRETPAWALVVRSKQILDLQEGLSAGLRLWIEREVWRQTEPPPSTRLQPARVSRSVVRSAPFEARVEQVAQRVAEHVEAEHGEGQGHRRPDREPRRAIHVVEPGQ